MRTLIVIMLNRLSDDFQCKFVLFFVSSILSNSLAVRANATNLQPLNTLADVKQPPVKKKSAVLTQNVIEADPSQLDSPLETKLINRIDIRCGVEAKNNCIFDQNSPEIRSIIQSVEGKSVTLLDLKDIADRITKLYLKRGYITSRGNLLAQKFTDGVAVITIVEGGIEDIQIEGLKLVKAEYIKSRIRLARLDLLNQYEIEERLKLLLTDPLFKNIEPTLRPGKKFGQSILFIKVTEADSLNGSIGFDNFSAPGVGSEQLKANLTYRNWNRSGDRLATNYKISTTGGSELYDFAYAVPVNANDSSVQIHAALSRFKVTDPQLVKFNIHGNSNLYEITYRQPLIRSTKEEFGLSLGFSYQDGQTFVLNQPTALAIGADVNGITRTSVIKLSQDYVKRDVNGTWSVQSSLNFGTGLFNATKNIKPIPDSHFMSFTAQAQRFQQLNPNNFLIATLTTQLTPDSLLSAQQFLIGGESVRGFRQNARYGDNGISLSVEDRIVLRRNQSGGAVFQLAPFIDTGVVWNQANNPSNTFRPTQNFLAGVGIGMIWNPDPQINIRVDYSLPLVKLTDRGNNLQDQAIYVRASYGF